MDNVRLYHQSLQEETAPPSGSSCIITNDANPSSPFLISTLRYNSSHWNSNVTVLLLKPRFFSFNRKKLCELDNIRGYFNRKLSPPIFSSWSEQDFAARRHDNQKETDACQLLIKSKELVREVNSIITGELFTTIHGAVIFVIRITIYRLKVKPVCHTLLENFVTINGCIQDN